MPWLTAAEALDRVANYLKYADGAGPSEVWEDATERAREDARQDILAALIARGYTRAQVEAWDALTHYHESQTIYRAITYGAGTGDYSDAWVEKLNMAEDLKKVLLVAGGEADHPEGREGQVNTGRWGDSDESVFSLDVEW